MKVKYFNKNTIIKIILIMSLLIVGVLAIRTIDVIPNLNATYDLGNLTYMFRDLYLSRNAYIGGNVSASYYSGDGSRLTDVKTYNLTYDAKPDNTFNSSYDSKTNSHLVDNEKQYYGTGNDWCTYFDGVSLITSNAC